MRSPAKSAIRCDYQPVILVIDQGHYACRRETHGEERRAAQQQEGGEPYPETRPAKKPLAKHKDALHSDSPNSRFAPCSGA
jgi:hypothetical protein